MSNAELSANGAACPDGGDLPGRSTRLAIGRAADISVIRFRAARGPTAMQTRDFPVHHLSPPVTVFAGAGFGPVQQDYS